MLVALIDVFGDAPAQIENAARLDDIEHAGDRRRNLRAVEMHDHGFAQHIVVSVGRDAAQLRQLRMREVEIRISRARLGQQTVGRVKSHSRKTIRIQPRHLAPAAAADIGGRAALDEEALDDVVQIDRRRLLVPVFRERRRIVIVSGERSDDPRDQPSILEKSATARVAARISFRSFRRFSRTFGSSSLTLTLSKNASTAGRKLGHRAHRGGEVFVYHGDAGFDLHLVDRLRERPSLPRRL